MVYLVKPSTARTTKTMSKKENKTKESQTNKTVTSTERMAVSCCFGLILGDAGSFSWL